MDPAALFGYAAATLAILGALGVFASNVLYSRPRIEAQARQIRNLQDDAATAFGVSVEKDKRLSFLEDMVKSVPAFAELTQAVVSLNASFATHDANLKIHEERSQSREEKIVTALEAIATRLERKGDHRDGESGSTHA